MKMTGILFILGALFLTISTFLVDIKFGLAFLGFILILSSYLSFRFDE